MIGTELDAADMGGGLGPLGDADKQQNSTPRKQLSEAQLPYKMFQNYL